MIFVDPHIAFGGALEFHARRSRRDLVDVEAASLFHRRFPQPWTEIGRLGHISDHGLLAPHLLELGDECLVVRVVQGLEILHTGEGSSDILAADPVDLVFRYGDCQQRLLRQIDTCCLQLLVECDVRPAHDDGIDDVGFGQLDLVDDRVELGMTQREVFLADHLGLQIVLDVLARNFVRRAWPDVIRAEQVECFRALLFRHPIQTSDDLLGGFLAGVDDVLRLLETFVEGRIVEHPVVLLEHRQYRLARSRRPATHDRGAFVVDEKFFGLFGERRPVACAVFLNELDLAAEHTAGSIDLLDRELLSLHRPGFADRHRSGYRMQNADRHFAVGYGETRRVDNRGRRACTE